MRPICGAHAPQASTTTGVSTSPAVVFTVLIRPSRAITSTTSVSVDTVAPSRRAPAA